MENPLDGVTQPAAEQEAAPAPPSGQAATVVYAEDNPSNLRLVERIVALRPAVRLLSVVQGRRCLELVRAHRPDAIFLDLHLPDMDGYAVLRELRTDPATRGIPVVVVSADATPRQIRRLLAAGSSAYLTKPLNVAQFLNILDRILAGHPVHPPAEEEDAEG